MALPDFICIGAQKAGTSWLSNQLRHHPHVWVPPYKELHFFDWQRPRSIGDYRKVLRFRFGTHLEKRRLRNLPSRIADALGSRRWSEVRWYARYHLGIPRDSWYARLFPPRQEGLSRGELTPDYCVLDHKVVREVRALMPDVKIIMVLRDPIERAWSHARMFLGKYSGKDVGEIQEDELIAFLDSRSVRRRSTYTDVLDVWQSEFSSEQILLIWNEEIREHPEELMKRVSDFLEVKPAGGALADSIHKTVHAGQPVPMPPPVARHLAQYYRREIESLDNRYGGYATHWLERADAILQGVQRPTQ